MLKRAFAGTVATVAAVTLSAGSAFAGEVNGNGGDVPAPDHARSECAFSGLDDDDDDGFGRTQNWGSIPKAERDFLRSIGVSPEALCNGHKNPQK
ncbi:MAG: hypothetical protein HKN44_05515 [Ilumatobacter sp.]|nr:hypothetical protein [Ilumatobacter sp.]